jgi:hypothetical protein|tara:strand:- start:39 stop:155 length:117 start_codon:yes stop_codon:yes gene_type:complete
MERCIGINTGFALHDLPLLFNQDRRQAFHIFRSGPLRR